MESNSELPLATLVSIPKNQEGKKDADANKEFVWWSRGKMVGSHQNASIINTFDGMQEVNVIKDTHLYYLYDGMKDSCDCDASNYSPLENIGETLGFKGPLWDEWWKRIVALGDEGKRLTTRHFDMGFPYVR